MSAEGSLARGDVWRFDFGADPTDPEQAFLRPAVIVSDDRLHHPNLGIVIVVPGTSTIRNIPLHVVISPDSANGLDAETAFQPEQVRAVSARRLTERLGYIDDLSRHEIDEKLRNTLSL